MVSLNVKERMQCITLLTQAGTGRTLRRPPLTEVETCVALYPVTPDTCASGAASTYDDYCTIVVGLFRITK